MSSARQSFQKFDKLGEENNRETKRDTNCTFLGYYLVSGSRITAIFCVKCVRVCVRVLFSSPLHGVNGIMELMYLLSSFERDDDDDDERKSGGSIWSIRPTRSSESSPLLSCPRVPFFIFFDALAGWHACSPRQTRKQLLAKQEMKEREGSVRTRCVWQYAGGRELGIDEK